MDTKRWSELPVDLLEAIGKRIQCYRSYVRCRAVCLRWSLTLPRRPAHIKIPWLLLPYKDESQTIRGFFNLIEKKEYELELPEARGKIFRGSSFGWLVAVEDGPRVQLLNPFTRHCIDLPSLLTFPGYDIIEEEDREWARDYFVTKIILSSDPSEGDDFMAIGLFLKWGGTSHGLAFCRGKDEAWTEIPIPHSIYEDFVFYEGRLYMVDCVGKVAICDMFPSPKTAETLYQPPGLYPTHPYDGVPWYYVMVSSQGEVMLIRRHYFVELYASNDKEPGENPFQEEEEEDEEENLNHEDEDDDEEESLNQEEDEEEEEENPNQEEEERERVFYYQQYRTTGFSIYKLHFKDDKDGIEECSAVGSLGRDMVLLGYNSTISLPYSHFKGNHICFTDNLHEHYFDSDLAGHDIGMYDLEDGSVSEFEGYTLDHGLDKIPIWNGVQVHAVTSPYWPNPLWVLGPPM